MVAESPMNVSINYSTAEDFTAARHTYELVYRPEIYLILVHAMAGLGSASVSLETLLEYPVPADK